MCACVCVSSSGSGVASVWRGCVGQLVLGSEPLAAVLSMVRFFASPRSSKDEGAITMQQGRSDQMRGNEVTLEVWVLAALKLVVVL